MNARCPLARSLLLASALALSMLTPARHNAAPAAGSSADRGDLAGIRPEGRLRKLHLVRPDLIPYPIAYEVYC